MRKKEQNLNYDFEEQVEPKRRMGQGKPSNLPQEPIMEKFSNKISYRGGIPNSFTASISEISGIEENRE